MAQSTMHRIAGYDLDKAYDKHTDKRVIAVMKEKSEAYNKLKKDVENGIYDGYESIEEARNALKEKYLELLYTNPAGFILTAGMTTNYRQLKTIYRQRKNHRLPEWRIFCKWLETLPCSELITGNRGESDEKQD